MSRNVFIRKHTKDNSGHWSTTYVRFTGYTLYSSVLNVLVLLTRSIALAFVAVVVVVVVVAVFVVVVERLFTYMLYFFNKYCVLAIFLLYCVKLKKCTYKWSVYNISYKIQQAFGLAWYNLTRVTGSDKNRRINVLTSIPLVSYRNALYYIVSFTIVSYRIEVYCICTVSYRIVSYRIVSYRLHTVCVMIKVHELKYQNNFIMNNKHK